MVLMRDYKQVVEREETRYDFGQGIVVSMPPERARVLKDDLNRVLQALRNADLANNMPKSVARLAMLVADLEKETR